MARIHVLSLSFCRQALCDFILSSCYDNLTFAALRTMVTLSRSVAADLIHCDKGKLNSVPVNLLVKFPIKCLLLLL